MNNIFTQTKNEMAKPIKETPVIKGRDARRFRENINKTENNKISAHQLAAMQANYNKLMSFSVRAK